MKYIAAFVLQLIALSVFGQQPIATRGDAEYEIQDDVLIKTTAGATLSATVIRLKSLSTPAPTLLSIDIYTQPAVFLARGKEVAARGYVSVTVDTRGKRLSPDDVAPYEHEAKDSYDVIDWIARQSWSDGQVGMWGGSYLGFSAWATSKRLHPALKTFAVSAAAMPGMGLPMHNNIFLNANYGWAFYVTNNKYLDDATYKDNARWRKLSSDWFSSGKAYRELDQVDRTPNPWLQRWLKHPAYDEYWQSMVPYKKDFAKIKIPVLTITGYYDDGQISALHYLRQHYEFNKSANHYLVIGPYDHVGTHAAKKPLVLRDYTIDAAAQFNTRELTYQWMDYVLRKGSKPDLLKGRINYQVMGANEWRHAVSLQELNKAHTTLYFSDVKDGDRYKLSPKRSSLGALEQSIDLSNRNIFHNYHYYPYPIIQEKLEYVTELLYVSAPFDRNTTISGSFAGELAVTINKRDVDLGVTVFEEMADGKLFHLGYWLGRASYARDSSVRDLLTPGKKTRIPFETSFTSKQLSKGSRLLFLLDVNYNPSAQVNYGTGKDVSDESIADAKEPLQVKWHTDSYVNIPFDK